MYLFVKNKFKKSLNPVNRNSNSIVECTNQLSQCMAGVAQVEGVVVRWRLFKAVPDSMLRKVKSEILTLSLFVIHGKIMIIHETVNEIDWKTISNGGLLLRSCQRYGI